MAKDLEQLIAEYVVPDMEYEPKYDKKRTKKKGLVTVTIDDIPEVVLPKTKSEVISEAKDRLTQKSTASSKKKRGVSSDETAATVTLEHRSADVTSRTKTRNAPVWVGDSEELVPFAWRNPLIESIENQSKVYQALVKGKN